MPEHIETPLAYLMDMLYIQGTKLAKAVHVDRTVVSRWKNGRAKLNGKSIYFSDVINAILDINEQQGLKKLERFLGSVNNTEISDRETLYRYVASWLLSDEFERSYQEPDKGKSLYTASYKIYKGPTGKRDAVVDLLNVLLSLPDGETVWGYDADSRIFHTMANDLTLSQKKFVEAVKKHQLNAMFYMNRPAEQIYNMFSYWLPIFLSTNMHAYYTYHTDVPYYDYIYSIKGKLALVGSNHEDNPAGMYTAIYDDPMTVRQIDAFLEKHLDDFSELMRHLQHKDICSDFQEGSMGGYMTNNMDQYVIAEVSPFITFTKETIEDVIFDLQLEPREERKVLQFYKNCAINSKKFFAPGDNMTRVIFSMDYLQGLSEETMIESPTFTQLLGRPVRISSKYLLHEVEYFSTIVKDDPHIEIALRPSGTEPFLSNLNLWVKENTVAYFHPSDDLSVRVLTDEFASVNAFYSMIDKFWDNLPYECKQQSWVYEQIAKMKQ